MRLWVGAPVVQTTKKKSIDQSEIFSFQFHYGPTNIPAPKQPLADCAKRGIIIKKPINFSSLFFNSPFFPEIQSTQPPLVKARSQGFLPPPLRGAPPEYATEPTVCRWLGRR